LRGEYREAAKVAWEKARAASDDFGYHVWVNAAAAAVRCHDQSYAGRAADFIKWTQGELKDSKGQEIEENPLADFLAGKKEE